MEELTTASQAGSQEAIMVGSIGSHFDLGSVMEGTREFRAAGEEICSVGAPSVREGEFVDGISPSARGGRASLSPSSCCQQVS